MKGTKRNKKPLLSYSIAIIILLLARLCGEVARIYDKAHLFFYSFDSEVLLRRTEAEGGGRRHDRSPKLHKNLPKYFYISKILLI